MATMLTQWEIARQLAKARSPYLGFQVGSDEEDRDTFWREGFAFGALGVPECYLRACYREPDFWVGYQAVGTAPMRGGRLRLTVASGGVKCRGR